VTKVVDADGLAVLTVGGVYGERGEHGDGCHGRGCFQRDAGAVRAELCGYGEGACFEVDISPAESKCFG
jgi:hypothetical protein